MFNLRPVSSGQAVRRKSIISEFIMAFKYLPFPQGEHPKLLSGDDLPKTIKEISETNNVVQCLTRKPFFSNNRTISMNPKNQICGSSNEFLLQGGRGQRGLLNCIKYTLLRETTTIKTTEYTMATTTSQQILNFFKR